MPALDLAHNHPRRNVRLDTLVRLRWLAIVGQTTAVLVVYFGLDFDLPLWACLAVIALSAWLNVALRLRFYMTQRLEPDRAAWLLAFDIAELAVLLFLTGGLQNPFAFLFLAPVLLSATALPPRFTVILGAFAVACATVLVFVHYPLPWDADDPLRLPPIYMAAVWLAILLSIGFIGVYAWQITEESRQLSDALAATELVLAREQHLSQLDGLAAAAAHELGTPLSTITVIARELENAIAADAPHGDDVRLLREQARRCRDILSKITQLSSSGEPFDRMPLSALMEEVVAPYRNFGVAIDVRISGDGRPEPAGARNPAVLYGLGNLMENAVDFAQEQVVLGAIWTEETLEISITDDGPGFAPEIIARIGEPYVTSRPGVEQQDEPSGLGLGFFIAKTLLERAGASLSFENRVPPERGAVVFARWNRSDFERPLHPAAA
ncbi:MAG TPA: ActS/PrrB/RegB family redox-sensitive histidine kinase [Pseudolabrys sp.]|jgi:two-component system sensor histidine kinase RegB|uniref:ActS/PrrB/RegB family redox-sensitive histidine kinase n=1 Tax=Pseudolabrys sp. TaxID=1960880 RepID=UPI002DDD459B|nr:ActS/PrrB/RegB family redox-sensitive histidine kinase [Pseudolabrys sp.]HEV2629872.1 ActS/PrrB/RegB family redox-sensitive histidine kinase [Pseudolabrys sp.]